jgi:hypothetical protein
METQHLFAVRIKHDSMHSPGKYLTIDNTPAERFGMYRQVHLYSSEKAAFESMPDDVPCEVVPVLIVIPTVLSYEYVKR